MRAIALLVLAALVVQDDAKDFWWFTPGTEWIYDVKEGDHRKSTVMEVLQNKNGKLLVESKEYAGNILGASKTETLTWCANDGFVTWSKMQDGKEVELFRLLKIGSVKGTTWKSRLGGAGPEHDVENSGTETITVAGRNREATHVVLKLTGKDQNSPAGTIDFFLVRGLGVVKAELKAGGATAFLMELREHYPAR